MRGDNAFSRGRIAHRRDAVRPGHREVGRIFGLRCAATGGRLRWSWAHQRAGCLQWIRAWKTAFASALTKSGAHMAACTVKPISIGLRPSGKSWRHRRQRSPANPLRKKSAGCLHVRRPPRRLCGPADAVHAPIGLERSCRGKGDPVVGGPPPKWPIPQSDSRYPIVSSQLRERFEIRIRNVTSRSQEFAPGFVDFLLGRGVRRSG
jgi:hypothetical protein